MSQITDFSKLAKMAEEVLMGKEFFVSTVIDRVREAQRSYPHDQAMRTAEEVLKGRLNKKGSLATITQQEFQKIYEQVNNLGNRTAFRELLGDLLLVEAAGPVANYNSNFASSIRNSDSEIDLVNHDLLEDLNGLFSNASPVETGSYIDNGRIGLELELAAMGFSNPVEVIGKTSEFVVYATEIQSSHGRIPAYFPAEIKVGTVLMPSVFVSGNEFKEFTAANLKAHAHAVAGGLRTAQAHEIMAVLRKNAASNSNLTALASDDYMHIALDSPSLYQNFVETRPEMISVEMPTPELPKQLEHLTEGLVHDALVEAGLSFNHSTVLAAKNLVSAELKAMGMQVDKVAIASEFTNGIMVGAQLRGTGGIKTIQVPVEITTAGQLLMPSVFTSGTHVDSFDAPSILSFANQKVDGIFNAAFSDKISWNFKQLHNHALKCAAYGQFIEAEEALAVIADQYGEDFHKVAFADLVELLNIGVASEEKPLDSMEKYMKEAIAKAADKENNIRMSGTLMYLYPED